MEDFLFIPAFACEKQEKNKKKESEKDKNSKFVKT